MEYYEYKAQDGKVLFNPERGTYGDTILSKYQLNFYVIDRDLAKQLQYYFDTEDKSQIPMMVDAEGISYNDLNDWLSHMFILNEGVVKTVKNTEQTN